MPITVQINIEKDVAEVLREIDQDSLRAIAEKWMNTCASQIADQIKDDCPEIANIVRRMVWDDEIRKYGAVYRIYKAGETRMFSGSIEEEPSATAEGWTLEEVRENLRTAAAEAIMQNRLILNSGSDPGTEVIREPLLVEVPGGDV